MGTIHTTEQDDMSNFNTMTAIAYAAKKASNNAKLDMGVAHGTIAGRTVKCIAVPVRTNGRCITQMTWYIDGSRTSKAKVAAL